MGQAVVSVSSGWQKQRSRTLTGSASGRMPSGIKFLKVFMRLRWHIVKLVYFRKQTLTLSLVPGQVLSARVATTIILQYPLSSS
jgi:hypothetical protein